MKRFLSVCLILCMILPCLALVGCDSSPRLSSFVANKMRKVYVEQFEITNVTAESVVMDYYAGKYGDCEIVMLDAECHEPEEQIEVEVGFSFRYFDSNRLLAWHDGKFYTLSEAYCEHLLSADDVKEIANKFNSEVTCFRDTGDQFDYSQKEYVNWKIFRKQNNINISVGPFRFDVLNRKIIDTTCVTVTMDRKASYGNVTPPLSFFGEDMFEEIIDNSKTNQDVYSKDFEQTYDLVLKNQTLLGMYLAITRLEKIPGIKCAREHAVMYFCKTPNDTSYTNADYRWALDNIEVEEGMIFKLCE